MSLTETAAKTRIIINVTASITIVYLTLFFSWPYLQAYYKSLFPAPVLPERVFGLLDRPNIKSIPISTDSSLEYILETKNARLPNNVVQPMFSVFKVVKPPISFNSGKAAQEKAKVLGFEEANLTRELNGNIYQWADPELSRKLDINISQNSVTYDTDWVKNINAYKTDSKYLISASRGQARQILSSIGFLKDPLYNNGFQTVVMGKIVNNKIEETTTPDEYTFAKVDFFRKIGDKYPVYGPRFNESLIQTWLSVPKDSEKRKDILPYVKIKAVEWGIDIEKRGRYTSDSLESAWNKVRSNKGFVTQVLPKGASRFQEYTNIKIAKIYIQKITLGYYESPELIPVVQPIYVFEGTYLTPEQQPGTIVIYTEALSDENFKN